MLLEILSLLSLCETYNLSPYENVVSYYEQPQNTASGEWFTGLDYTAASPNLPLGAIVVLQYNDRVISVRINDRGPFAVDSNGKAIFPLQPHPTRKLDLSITAFRDLIGNTDCGTAKVRIIKIEV